MRNPYLWIIAAVLLVYAHTAFFGFTGLDDSELIVSNSDFISEISNIPKAFFSRVFPHLPAPYYRPILTVTFMLDAVLAGRDPAVYHITNIIIHAAASCLLFYVLSRLGLGLHASVFLALLFAVHPALAQGVAWIPGRNDSLMALFALASFAAFLNYLDRRRPADYLAHMAFFVAGLFTKETSAMLALICLLYLRVAPGRRLSRREFAAFVLGWAAAAAVWFLMRHAALKNTPEFNVYSAAESFFVSLPAVIQYIGKVLMPFNLSVFPTIYDTTFVYGVASVLAVSVALRLSAGKNPRLVIFGMAWFLLFLAPSLVRPSAAAVHDFQEHRLYLPMAGAMIALGGSGLLKDIAVSKRTQLLCAGILALFAFINIRYSSSFADKISFWDAAVEGSPRSWLTHYRKASVLHEDGRLDEAEREYLRAVGLDRVSSPAYAGLGRLYADRGAPDGAEPALRKALAACPLNYPCNLELGAIYYKQGRLSEAAAMWISVLKIQPGNETALKNMAILCAEEGDAVSARFYADKMLRGGMAVPPEFLKRIGYE